MSERVENGFILFFFFILFKPQNASNNNHNNNTLVDRRGEGEVPEVCVIEIFFSLLRHQTHAHITPNPHVLPPPPPQTIDKLRARQAVDALRLRRRFNDLSTTISRPSHSRHTPSDTGRAAERLLRRHLKTASLP